MTRYLLPLVALVVLCLAVRTTLQSHNWPTWSISS